MSTTGQILSTLKRWSLRASPQSWIIGAGLVAALLSLTFFSPVAAIWTTDLNDLPKTAFETVRVPGLLQQLHDPFGWDHFTIVPNALRWRLLPPVVGHQLGLSPRAYFALAPLGMALLLVVALNYIHRATGRPAGVGFTALLITTSSAFFTTTGWLGQFDAYYLLGLVMFVFSTHALTIWAVCMLAPWCDERFLLILPACVCLKRILARSSPEVAAETAGRGWSVPMILGLSPYVALRLWATAQGDSSLPIQLMLQRQHFDAYLPHVPAGWWMGFRAGWIPVVLGLTADWRLTQMKNRLAMGLTIIGGLGAIVLLAWDSSRSIAVLLPFQLCGCIVVIKRWPRHGLRLLAALALLNLALPASYVTNTYHVPIRSAFFH